MSRRAIRPALGAAIALVLALDVAAGYQLGVRAHRPPAFRRGGAFAASRPLDPDRPLPYTPLTSPTSTTVASTISAPRSSSTPRRRRRLHVRARSRRPRRPASTRPSPAPTPMPSTAPSRRRASARDGFRRR